VYLEAVNQLSPTSLGSLPFLTGGARMPLTPLAQIDPLVALLSALPADTRGSLLGGLGTVHHAFGLPLTLRLWQVYVLLGCVLTAVIALVTPRLVPVPVRARSGSRDAVGSAA
jgi:hypothetical protein